MQIRYLQEVAAAAPIIEIQDGGEVRRVPFAGREMVVVTKKGMLVTALPEHWERFGR